MTQWGYSGFRRSALFTLLLAFTMTHAVHAATIDDLQTGWETAKYQLMGTAQTESFEQLIKTADAFTAANPDVADGWLWSGIIKSSFAGIEGGLGALGLAKKAKADFERSIELDPDAMQGSAYTSLGTLYAGVPGWPLGFGDDKKAEQYLLKGLELDPAGIDSNYFYAQFLADHKRKDEARKYYEAALRAPARPGRNIADAGRQAEVRAALAKLDD